MRGWILSRIKGWILSRMVRGGFYVFQRMYMIKPRILELERMRTPPLSGQLLRYSKITTMVREIEPRKFFFLKV